MLDYVVARLPKAVLGTALQSRGRQSCILTQQGPHDEQADFVSILLVLGLRCETLAWSVLGVYPW